MFTGFDFGITSAQIMAQVTALLGNTLVIALVGGGIALTVAPRLVSFVKRTFGGRG